MSKEHLKPYRLTADFINYDERYATIDDALAEAEEIIEEERKESQFEGEWPEDVQSIRVEKLVHHGQFIKIEGDTFDLKMVAVDPYTAERERSEREHPASEWHAMERHEMYVELHKEVEELARALWVNDLHGEHGILKEALHVRIVAERIAEEMVRRSKACNG